MQIDETIQKPFYACQSMLSHYVPTDPDGDIAASQEIDEKQLLENTYVSVRYRTRFENEE